MFFSAILTRSANAISQPSSVWNDESTADHYVFRSPFGTVELRKRVAYPSTFVTIEGAILKAGYGGSVNVGDDSALYSEEFLNIIIDCNEQTVNVQRDAFCTVPLFALHSKDKLGLASSFTAVCSVFKGEELRINKPNLYAFISGTSKDHLETYIENCIILGALERFSWIKGVVSRSRQSLPLSAPFDTYDGDPLVFRQFLDTLLAEYAQKYAKSGSVACEFSGGIDSSIVAGYLADNGHDPLLLTVGHIDSFQDTQKQKIQDFQNRFHTRHLTVDLDEERTFPLSRMAVGEKWYPFYEHEETYREAFQALARGLPEAGVTTVFNGLGGDDALARFDFSYDAKSLPPFYTEAFRRLSSTSVSPKSTDVRILNQFIDQKVNCNNLYLDNGIWPVAPFTDPRFIMYCQVLKPRFRDNKNIFRMYCHAWQYPESIYNATVNEDFRAFFRSCGDRYFMGFTEKWLQHSVLAATGMIDEQEALAYARQLATNEGYFDVYRLIVAESNFQTLGITK